MKDRIGEVGSTILRQGPDERSVRPGDARTGDLEPRTGQLVAENPDLGVLGDNVDPVNAHEVYDTVDLRSRRP